MQRLSQFAGVLIGTAVLTSAAQATLTFDFSIAGNGQNNGRNDVRLNRVSQGGVTYDRFIGPTAVSQLTVNGAVNNSIRVVAGPDSSVSKKVSVLGDANSGAVENNATFRSTIQQALSQNNVNRFVDMSGNPAFTMTLDFAAGTSGKLLWTERGSGGSNSWVVLSAVDANGNRINGSKQFLIDPSKATPTGIKGATYFDVNTNPSFGGTQDIGGQLIDIQSAFGINSISRVQISIPVVGTNYGGTTFHGLGNGQDFQPDFRLVNAVPEPGTMIAIGAGLAGLISRKRKKA